MLLLLLYIFRRRRKCSTSNVFCVKENLCGLHTLRLSTSISISLVVRLPLEYGSRMMHDAPFAICDTSKEG